MNKPMMSLSRFFRRFSVPAMWASLPCIASAYVSGHFFQSSGLCAFFYLAAFIMAGSPIVFRAIQSLMYKTVSIEMLVSIAALGACIIGEYNEAAVVSFLFLFGSFLEQKTMKKTRSAIRNLTEMAPKTALRLSGKDWEEIDADEAEPDDILLVRAGSQIAADGIVVQGEGYVTEAAITGEPDPKHKKAGDSVFSGTVLDSGTIQIRATKVGEDTTFARIIALVEEAQDAKSPAERFIDRFAEYYTPSVIVLALMAFVITRSTDTAITVLVLACPGALVIGAPIANVAGIGRGAEEGILLKGGDSIHSFAKTDAIAFDKTGTLTEGKPEVIEEHSYTDDRDNVLMLAASAERFAEHPLAAAVVRYAGDITYADFDSAEPKKGRGIVARKGRCSVIAGNARMMNDYGISIPAEAADDIASLHDKDAGIILIAVNGVLSMVLGVSDVIREDAADSIQQLKKLGVKRLLMLTGDNGKTASSVSEALGIGEHYGELLPEDKLMMIRKMQEEGYSVTFVGDGINDSPALAAADTGIAIGGGTDAAIDSSDVVLIKSDLESLVRALSLSKRTVNVLYENIAIAVGTVLLLLFGLFAGYVHMSVGMLIHEASILVVIFNAMRLLIPSGRRKGK